MPLIFDDPMARWSDNPILFVHVGARWSIFSSSTRVSEQEVCVEESAICSPSIIRFYIRLIGTAGPEDPAAGSRARTGIQARSRRFRQGKSRQTDPGVDRQGQEGVRHRLRDVSWKGRR